MVLESIFTWAGITWGIAITAWGMGCIIPIIARTTTVVGMDTAGQDTIGILFTTGRRYCLLSALLSTFGSRLCSLSRELPRPRRIAGMSFGDVLPEVMCWPTSGLLDRRSTAKIRLG